MDEEEIEQHYEDMARDRDSGHDLMMALKVREDSE